MGNDINHFTSEIWTTWCSTLTSVIRKNVPSILMWTGAEKNGEETEIVKVMRMELDLEFDAADGEVLLQAGNVEEPQRVLKEEQHMECVEALEEGTAENPANEEGDEETGEVGDVVEEVVKGEEAHENGEEEPGESGVIKGGEEGENDDNIKEDGTVESVEVEGETTSVKATTATATTSTTTMPGG